MSWYEKYRELASATGIDTSSTLPPHKDVLEVVNRIWDNERLWDALSWMQTGDPELSVALEERWHLNIDYRRVF